MNMITAFTALALSISVSLAGCSGGNVSGTYKNDSLQNYTLRLSNDGKFTHTPWGPGEYQVDGKIIVISSFVFGSIEGHLESNKLVFPENLPGGGPEFFRGTWKKQ